jgi:antitoxin (DNA-binding transcriptional repressor) of toxin-antitoxin stability system
MTISVNIGAAKTRLSELVAASLSGEEVILARAGHAVARIVPIADAAAEAQAKARRKRVAQWDAYVGSFAHLLPANAGDLAMEPIFTDEEIDEFGQLPDVPSGT